MTAGSTTWFIVVEEPTPDDEEYYFLDGEDNQHTHRKLREAGFKDTLGQMSDGVIVTLMRVTGDPAKQWVSDGDMPVFGGSDKFYLEGADRAGTITTLKQMGFVARNRIVDIRLTR